MLKNEPFLSLISDTKKVLFWKKYILIFLLSDFAHFLPKTDFLLPDPLYLIADNSQLNKKWIVDTWFWTGFGALTLFKGESRNSSRHVQTCSNLKCSFTKENQSFRLFFFFLSKSLRDVTVVVGLISSCSRNRVTISFIIQLSKRWILFCTSTLLLCTTTTATTVLYYCYYYK